MSAITFEVRVGPGRDALHRIICVCHRRGLEIVALSYGYDELSLTLEGDERRMRQAERWLGALVDVSGVWRTHDPDAPNPRARAQAQSQGVS